jgi:hypothetical protein
MSENVGASTSRNPKGLHGLYRLLNLLFMCFKTGLILNKYSRKREHITEALTGEQSRM